MKVRESGQIQRKGGDRGGRNGQEKEEEDKEKIGERLRKRLGTTGEQRWGRRQMNQEG